MNPLTWQNPGQLFVAQDIIKVKIYSVAELRDSLRLFNEIKNKQHGDEAFNRLPIRLRGLSNDPKSYLICLIVHGHQLDWLVGLQDAFRDVMREVVTEWNIQDSNVRVYNEETALESKLIVAYIPKEERDSVRETDAKSNMSAEKAKEWFHLHNTNL